MLGAAAQIGRAVNIMFYIWHSGLGDTVRQGMLFLRGSLLLSALWRRHLIVDRGMRLSTVRVFRMCKHETGALRGNDNPLGFRYKTLCLMGW